jgi:glycoside hydrolase-like protein
MATFPAFTDHSWGRPGAQAIKGAGYLGVMRYLGDPSNGRNLGKPEMDSYHRVGLLVGFIWEGAANRVLSGFSGGAQDGPAANDWADKLGVPNNVPIIGTTVDFQASVDQLRGPIADYAKGFSRNSKRPQLPYGSDTTLNVLCGELGLFPCGWQTRAWSAGRVSRFACMIQEVGYVLGDTSDHNSILMLDEATKLGWNPNIVTPKPQEDEDVKAQILWTKADSQWARDVAGLTENRPYAFWWNGGMDIKYLQNDDETNWIRWAIVATGGNLAEQEKRDVPDVVFRTYSLVSNKQT